MRDSSFCQLRPLFTYILGGFLVLILLGRSERLAVPFSDVGIDKTSLIYLFCSKPLS